MYSFQYIASSQFLFFFIIFLLIRSKLFVYSLNKTCLFWQYYFIFNVNLFSVYLFFFVIRLSTHLFTHPLISNSLLQSPANPKTLKDYQDLQPAAQLKLLPFMLVVHGVALFLFLATW